jgi:DNA-binding GntR family transcriptional regulator
MTLKRASVSEHIKQLLLDRILDGTYKPGERLIELQIANELSTSQAPVREAFRYLEALGVVETETYKGTRVRTITERELKESSQIRAVLEELAGNLAAPALKGNVENLRAEAAKFVEAAKEKDFANYSKHDIEFHRIIVEAADNKLLLSIWESVVLESRFRLTLSRIGQTHIHDFATAHLPVIAALESGNGPAAGALLKELICEFHFIKFSAEPQ